MGDAEDQRLCENADARREKAAEKQLFAKARQAAAMSTHARQGEVLRDRAQIGMQLLREAESLDRETRGGHEQRRERDSKDDARPGSDRLIEVIQAAGCDHGLPLPNAAARPQASRPSNV